MSDAEVETIARWVDTGAPKGDPKDAPQPRVFPADHTWQFGEEPDLIVTSPPITVPANGPDLYPEPEAATGMTPDTTSTPIAPRYNPTTHRRTQS